MESKLYSVDQVVDLINTGKLLSLAGDNKVLETLPKGNWIAGSIPYFMDVDKGVFNQEKIYVHELETLDNDFKIVSYDNDSISNIVKDSFDNGFTIAIFPPFSEVLQEYSLNSTHYEGLYNNPIVGWVSGIDLNSADIPRVYNGMSGEVFENKAVAIHVKLPQDSFAQIEIVNIFERDEQSDEIEFFTDSFDVINCQINGKEANLAKYFENHNIDVKLPLVADYSGALINVSIKEIDAENEFVSFYAPVFKGVSYKFAKPINDYIHKFEVDTLNVEANSAFSCNCILNYLYGELEGKKINNVKGPITFGEIGYQLLNQTLVNLYVEKQ